MHIISVLHVFSTKQIRFEYTRVENTFASWLILWLFIIHAERCHASVVVEVRIVPAAARSKISALQPFTAVLNMQLVLIMSLVMSSLNYPAQFIVVAAHFVVLSSRSYYLLGVVLARLNYIGWLIALREYFLFGCLLFVDEDILGRTKLVELETYLILQLEQLCNR